MLFGYARVSTAGQAKDGNSLESQKNLLIANGVLEKNIYQEHFTGKKTDRPQLNILLSQLQTGDTVIVTKLDRIARSLIQGVQLVNDLLDRGVAINILNIGMMDNTPASKLTRNIFFSFAEYERELILDRTSEGKALARLDPNFREGRPLKNPEAQIKHALELLETNSYTKVVKMTGISKSTLIRAKKRVEAKIKTV